MKRKILAAVSAEIHLGRRQRNLWRTVGAVSALVCAVPSFAIGADGQFVFSNDRLSVRVEVHGMPLGEILRRLLNNTSTDIKWRDPALEKQPTTGSFSGPIADVVRQVLRGTNFIVAYSDKDAVARVIVIGNSGQTTAVVSRAVLVPVGNSPPPRTTPPQQLTVQTVH
jgi:hypothetical protein